MFNNFANESARVVYLKGGPESGKSTISKFLGNYLEERHKVSNVVYLNMDSVSSLAVFASKVESIGSN
jgi:adenylylsulfate kinase-like enzyme